MGRDSVKRKITVIALCAMFFAIYGPAEAQQPVKNPRVGYVELGGVAPGTGSPTAANAKLEETVYSMLRRDNQLRTANLKVDADVTKNEVTLSGTVDSEAMRDKAVELAKTAQVGVVVNNRIKVKQDATNRTGKN
jgi:osmotically-inducible protein OsmY